MDCRRISIPLVLTQRFVIGGPNGHRVDAPALLHFWDRTLAGLSIFQHYIRTFQLFSIVYEAGTDHRTCQFQLESVEVAALWATIQGPVQDTRPLNVISPQPPPKQAMVVLR